MKKLLMLGAAAFVLTAPAAFAEDAVKEEVKKEDVKEGGPHHKGGMLEKIDADHDGNVSKAEFLAFHEERFKEIDTDGDGVITKAEGDAKKAEWKAKMKEKRAMKPKGDIPPPGDAPAPADVTPPVDAPAAQ